MFTSEGNPKVKIVETVPAKSKFAEAPDAFDICIKVVDINDENQWDWWRGEVSSNYGKGNHASETQAQMTFDTLVKLGFQGGHDLSRLDELVGTETTAWIKASEPNESGKVFYNVRSITSNGDYAPKAIDLGDASNRLAAMMVGATAPAATTTPAANAASVGNPFAPKS